MKTKHLLFSVVLFACFSIQSSFAKGKIIFYRESGYTGGGVDFKIFVNDSTIKLRNSSFNSMDCAPGDYTIALKNSATPALRLKVEDNKNYYIRFILNYGFWSATPQLILVDSLSAAPALRGDVIKDYNNKALWTHPKHKLGLNMDIGFGFQNTTMAVTTDNKDSKISAGGGVGFGLKYAYEFNRHFEGDVDLNYRFSELQPYLQNAKVTFSRTNLSITPLYIIPVGDGYLMRWKVGAGLDYHMSPSMSISTASIGGFKDEWKYDDAFGYHVRVIFEMYTNKNWSFIYGLNWCNTSYKFNSSGSYYPTGTELSKPDGSSIDLMLGAYYNF